VFFANVRNIFSNKKVVLVASVVIDANGNMTQRVEGGLTYTQTWDAENRLISVTVSGQTTQFIYDGDGNLVKKVKPDNSKTIYVGGIYEVDKTSGGSVTRTVTYYPVAGAMRINSTLYYVLKDHLGSASVITDASGTVLGEQRYYPFGETRLTTGSILTDKLYTGQREMAGLGIYHFNARFYSPKLGRFLSADTIVPNPANPQSLNRFSYVTNNPLRYIDPTGHWEVDGCAQNCGNTFVSGCGGAGQQSCGGSGGGGNGGGGGGGSGGGGGGGGGGDEDECDVGHCYETDNIVCPAEFNCTAEEMQEYATMFQYPGQLPWYPVQNGLSYIVAPFSMNPGLVSAVPGLGPLAVASNPLWRPLGAISVVITNNGLTLTNVSEPTHIFHVGDVERSYSQDADGAWHVTTIGTGTNDTPDFLGIPFGPIIDNFNDAVGPVAFNGVDNLLMAAYIAMDQ